MGSRRAQTRGPLQPPAPRNPRTPPCPALLLLPPLLVLTAGGALAAPAPRAEDLSLGVVSGARGGGAEQAHPQEPGTGTGTEHSPGRGIPTEQAPPEGEGGGSASLGSRVRRRSGFPRAGSPREGRLGSRCAAQGPVGARSPGQSRPSAPPAGSLGHWGAPGGPWRGGQGRCRRPGRGTPHSGSGEGAQAIGNWGFPRHSVQAGSPPSSPEGTPLQLPGVQAGLGSRKGRQEPPAPGTAAGAPVGGSRGSAQTRRTQGGRGPAGQQKRVQGTLCWPPGGRQLSAQPRPLDPARAPSPL